MQLKARLNSDDISPILDITAVIFPFPEFASKSSTEQESIYPIPLLLI